MRRSPRYEILKAPLGWPFLNRIRRVIFHGPPQLRLKFWQIQFTVQQKFYGPEISKTIQAGPKGTPHGVQNTWWRDL